MKSLDRPCKKRSKGYIEVVAEVFENSTCFPWFLNALIIMLITCWVRGTSAHPVNRFSWFHKLCPCLIRTSINSPSFGPLLLTWYRSFFVDFYDIITIIKDGYIMIWYYHLTVKTWEISLLLALYPWGWTALIQWFLVFFKRSTLGKILSGFGRRFRMASTRGV